MSFCTTAGVSGFPFARTAIWPRLMAANTFPRTWPRKIAIGRTSVTKPLAILSASLVPGSRSGGLAAHSDSLHRQKVFHRCMQWLEVGLGRDLARLNSVL